MRKIKILLSIGVLFFGIQIMNGQGWEEFYGTSEQNRSIGAIQANDGGYIAASYTGSPIFGIYVVKTDENGVLEWEQTYPNEFPCGSGSSSTNFVNQNDNDGSFLIGTTKCQSIYLLTIDQNGIIISEQSINQQNFHGLIEEFQLTSDGGIIMAGAEQDSDPQSAYGFLTKLDQNDSLEWTILDNNSGDRIIHSVKQTPDNGFIAVGPSFIKTDSLGNIEWEQQGIIWDQEFNFWLGKFINTDDNGYIALGLPLETGAHTMLTKLDENGNKIWEKVMLGFDSYYVEQTFDGGFIVSGESTIDDDKIEIRKFDENGNNVWTNTFDSDNQSSRSAVTVHQNQDSTYIICNTFNEQLHLIKTDELGNLFTIQIEGNIWRDSQADCIQQNDEILLEEWIVQAEKNDRTFYGTTDSSGYYNITVDTGNYVVNVVKSSTYWEACEDSITFSFTEFFDTTQIDYPMLAVVDCPLMEVDISTPFLRRCFENNYYIQYCNKGTILAEDVYITVAFDEYLTINSTSIPPSNVENNIYTFEVGDVAIGECGTFEVNVTVGCDSTALGQTHCVEANVFPDSLCLPLDPNWDQANIEVNAECMGDSILFIIQNTGGGNMGHFNDYVIIIDDLVLRSDEYQINSGTTKSFKEAANGETFRLQTTQTEGHPIGNMPSITIEGCGTEDPDSIHIGFVTQFPEDDDGPFVSIDCQENIGSYDPNDKQAYPKGVGEEHFIEQNIDIEYKIRFQNTGTDTAFTVVVIDTIAEFLEPTSIIPGASSHPYKFELYGYGVVKFTFDNILLVDSTTNEAGSHGFVKFRIAQKENNPLGTVIQNSASIYFDFNAPIKTNTTFHTVGEDFLALISSTSESAFENTSLSVYPNPVENVVTFHLEGVENVKQIELSLYDMTGRLLRTEMHNSSTFQFSKGDLLGGMYFYSIKTEKGEVNSGKLLVK